MRRPEKETPCPSVLGGEKGSRGGPSDLARRLSRYGNAKSHTLNTAGELGRDRLKAMGLNHTARLMECGNTLVFRDYYRSGHQIAPRQLLQLPPRLHALCDSSRFANDGELR